MLEDFEGVRGTLWSSKFQIMIGNTCLGLFWRVQETVWSLLEFWPYLSISLQSRCTDSVESTRLNASPKRRGRSQRMLQLQCGALRQRVR